MNRNYPTTELDITREQMSDLLNEDLSGEYQAIIAYLVFKHVLNGAAHTDIIRELEAHTGEELAHAVKIAKQFDHTGDIPASTPKRVKPTKDPVEMLRTNSGNKREMVRRYHERVHQAEAMSEFALSKT